ncbi:25033_t:CDS:2 [Cetraspora pellucida]|uniref:25033_t:CDS:1 n=1 Tax=Cetraspora pellucida TaxID=1433469 RepID=A0A9N9BWZ5_9GLOM|nr:25033_t:CDS:2 [Cetraspora pellucida]
MNEQSQILQESEFSLCENNISISDLNSYLSNLNANIYEVDTKINETWNSCKKLRENYETRIESFQQDLLKWLQKINKTIRQENEDLFQKEKDNEPFFHEKQESLKCLEKRINELQSMIEQKFSKSTLEGLFNHEFSQLKELFQDSTDADETTTDTSDLDLTYGDVSLQLCQDNRDLREQLLKKIRLNKIKIRELEESVKCINRLADECEETSLHVTEKIE